TMPPTGRRTERPLSGGRQQPANQGRLTSSSRASRGFGVRALASRAGSGVQPKPTCSSPNEPHSFHVADANHEEHTPYQIEDCCEALAKPRKSTGEPRLSIRRTDAQTWKTYKCGGENCNAHANWFYGCPSKITRTSMALVPVKPVCKRSPVAA